MISTDLLKANGWTAYAEPLWYRGINEPWELWYDTGWGSVDMRGDSVEVFLGYTKDLGVLNMLVAALESME